MLHCYIISYDLNYPGQRYNRLISHLKSFPGWAKITESTWAIVTDLDAVGLRDQLLQLTDKNDSIFVIQSSKIAAWNNTKCDSEWLKNNLVR